MEEIWWLAGIIEGEGSFRIVEYRTRKDSYALGIHLKMTDEDIVRRVHDVAGVGSVTGPYLKHGKNLPMWSWAVQNHEGIVKVLSEIYPLLGQRRRKRARDLLRYIERKRNVSLPDFLQQELRDTDMFDLSNPHITQARKTK